jgi:hypothetical protein
MARYEDIDFDADDFDDVNAYPLEDEDFDDCGDDEIYDDFDDYDDSDDDVDLYMGDYHDDQPEWM